MVFADTTRRRSTRPQPLPGMAPFGVIDIGSNSVRLVVYEGLTRAAATLFNEKVLCAIGRNMVSTGRLDEEGMARAFEALARFRAIADGLGVTGIEAAATAAARDATNGPEFVARAEAMLGAPIRVLSGEDEARIAAEGVLAAIPDADGLVGDLGGGSLDVVALAGGRLGQAATFPFGPLRLMDASGGRIDRARAIVDQALERAGWLGKMKGRAFYAVGGAWRTLARVHMADSRYPLRVLHQFTIGRDQAIRLAGVIAGLSRKSLERIPELPKRRAEGLPWASLVLERVLKHTALAEVVVSAHGLREGLHFRHLPAAEQSLDPLLASADVIARRTARSYEHVRELQAWTAPLLAGQTRDAERLRFAACALSDIAWRGHPDYRARSAFDEALQGPFMALDHRGRVFLAVTAFHRYAGLEEQELKLGRLGDLLDPPALMQARALGAALRLAYNLSAGAPGTLPETALTPDGSGILLTIGKARAALVAEVVTKRLAELGEALRRPVRIEVSP